MKNKTKSNLRITFSSLALAGFIIFALCDNLMVKEYTSYYTYGWRLGILNDLFLLVPFVALLSSSILERKLKHINGRVYVAWIFVLYTIQAIFIFFGDLTSEFSIFTCSFLGRVSDITIAILSARIFILLLTPVAHKIVLKIYSLGMLSFFGITIIAVLTTDNIYIRHSVPERVIALVIDILFHIALYFFSDLMDTDKGSTSWIYLLGTLMHSVFDSLYDDDKEDIFEELDDEYFKNKPRMEGDSKMLYNVSATINDIENGEGDNVMKKYGEFLSDDALNRNDTFEFSGDNFLLDPPENSILRYDLERKDNSTTVRGLFTHSFVEEQAARVLRKKSVLNKTFDDIELDAKADTDIGVEFIEEGSFIIRLQGKTFDTSDNYEAIRDYMLRFMEAIIIIQNTESYE